MPEIPAGSGTTLRSYSVLTLLSVAGLILLLSFLYGQNFREEREIRLRRNFSAFERQHNILDEQITLTAAHVEGIVAMMPALARSTMADQRARHFVERASSGVMTGIEKESGQTFGNLILPASGTDDRLVRESLVEEARATLAAVPLHAVAIERLPGVSNVFYLSRQGLLHTYPWRPRENIRLDEILANNDYVQRASQQGSPKAEWTEAYLDRAGNGWVTTCFASYLQDGRLIGVLGIDLEFAALARILEQGYAANGRYFLIDAKGRIFNSEVPPGERGTIKQLSRLSLVLGEPLASAILALPASAEGYSELADHRVARRPLHSTGLSLVHVVEDRKLTRSILQQYDELLFLLPLLLVLVLTVPQWIIRREMIVPANRLVALLESGESSQSPERMPRRWRPWFERVQLLLNEQRVLNALREEMAIARDIQRSLVPSAPMAGRGWHINGMMNPAKEVGGDAFDYFMLPDGRLVFLIADVSGKGVSAALYMSTMRVLMRALSRQGGTPADWLASANDYLAEDNPTAMFITACVGVFHPSEGEVCLANAGHLPPIVSEAGNVELLGGGKPQPALGIVPHWRYVDRIHEVHPGSSLLLYTDGVTEAESSQGRLYGTADLLALLKKTSATDWLSAIDQDLQTFAAGVAQSDDITALLLQRTGEGLPVFRIDPEPGQINAGIDAIAAWCLHQTGSGAAGAERIGRMRIILDELASNLHQHVGEGAALSCVATPERDRLTLDLSYPGAAFDPRNTDVANLETRRELTERRMGGMGLLLVRKLAKNVHWSHDGIKNRIRVVL